MNGRVLIMMGVAAMAMVSLTGCGVIRAPKLPKPLAAIDTQVTSVRVVDSSPVATRYDVVVELSNPNDEPLPLVLADYSLTVGDRTYSSQTLPLATIPKQGKISVTLPAIVEGAAGGSYQTSGRIVMQPAGQVRELMYEMGIPPPSASFSAQGSIETGTTTGSKTTAPIHVVKENTEKPAP